MDPCFKFEVDSDENELTIMPNKCDCLTNEIRFEFRSKNAVSSTPTIGP